MSKSKDIITGDDGVSDDSLIWSMTDSIRDLLGSISKILDDLISREDLFPGDDEFYEKYCKILVLYDRYRQELLNASGITVVCSEGCSLCCCHWVEDVNSFEAAVISRYLKRYYPDKVGDVIKSFVEDTEVFDSLRVVVDEKAAEYSSFPDEIGDRYELLLSCFYQLERPCALLDEKGRCVVYPVRPLSCRDYINLRDSEVCHPERINEEENATLVMFPPDTISQKLEILHRRFDSGSDNMSLRSLLIGNLEKG